MVASAKLQKSTRVITKTYYEMFLIKMFDKAQKKVSKKEEHSKQANTDAFHAQESLKWCRVLTENMRPSRVKATEWVPPQDTCIKRKLLE